MDYKSVMAYCVFETRRGFVALVGKNGKLTRSTLPKASRDEAIHAIRAGLDESAVEDSPTFGDLPEKLSRYFERERTDFSCVPVDLSGCGAFHAAALLAARTIPYGKIVSYGDLARMAGRQNAARAAGTAMANNSTPVIVPCHRVVASGGRLGGFSSGLEWKRELLSIEGVQF